MISIASFRRISLNGSFLKSLFLLSALFSFTACENDSDDDAFANQMKVDEEKIEAYIAENNLGNFQRTALGVYFQVTEEGSGPQAMAGKEVAVHYTLFNLAGKQLETSINNPRSNGEPLSFILGRGQVIKGWDDGIAQLKEGSKAILLIPSPLAYGSQSKGADMPANSILRFDVELVDVK